MGDSKHDSYNYSYDKDIFSSDNLFIKGFIAYQIVFFMVLMFQSGVFPGWREIVHVVTGRREQIVSEGREGDEWV